VTRAALLAAALAAGVVPPPGEPPPPRPALARAERTEVRLGEPFGYEIEVRHPADERVAIAAELDAPPFRGTGGECRRADGAAKAGEVRTLCSLRLALFALGPQDVPEVRLVVRTDRGESTLAVPGPRVTGVGVIDPAAPPESLALRAPAPPVPLEVPSLRLVWWTLGAVALVAAALLARRRWRRRALPAAAGVPPEPPGVRLARRLDALEAKGLPARGLGAEHVAELSTAVREWIGATAGVNALDLTTAELAERLGRAAVPGLDVGAVRRFCEEADLVKFARAPADAAACEAATRWARGLAAWTPIPSPTRNP
jgi:hypothetical protein